MKRLVCFILLLVLSVCLGSSVAAQDPNKVVLETNFGDIVLVLYPNDAPITVDNFLSYVNSGFYEGLIFHRVFDDFIFVIQGGAFDTQLNYHQPGDPIINESYNGLSNLRGTIAMARTGDPNSATSQFYINHIDNTSLDRDDANGVVGYCVFGHVVSDMNVVDTIAVLQTDWKEFPDGRWRKDVPRNHVIIYKAELYDAQTRMYVAPGGNDTTGTGASDAPFATIQKAIDMVPERGHVVVMPGTHTGSGNREIDFKNKAITVRSTMPADATTVAATVIDCQADISNQYRAFYFHRGEGSDSVLDGITITGGFSQSGAGIHCDNSSPTVRNCVITNNTSQLNGGGLYCYNNSHPTVIDCAFTANSANNGGGIFDSNSNPTFTNCIITNNTANYGAGMYCDGGKPLLVNCMLIDNTAANDGGGVYCIQGNPRLTNCNIVENTASGKGAAIYSPGGSPDVTNSIIWNNTGNDILNGIVNVAYSDIQDSWPGIGNLNVDPLFIDDANGDYHLKSTAWRWESAGGLYWYEYDPCEVRWEQPWLWDGVTSRCIDAGNPGSPLSNELLTVLYEAYFGTKLGKNERINIGAYGGTGEASMATFGWELPPDVTNDGIVDYRDLDYLRVDWLSGVQELAGDFDDNSSVNMADVWTLSTFWLDGCAAPDWCDGCDINQSGWVDLVDFASLSATFSITAAQPDIPWSTDFDQNNRVNGADLAILCEYWLQSTSWH